MKTLVMEPLDNSLTKPQKVIKKDEGPVSTTDRYLKGKVKMSSIMRYMPQLFTLNKNKDNG